MLETSSFLSYFFLFLDAGLQVLQLRGLQMEALLQSLRHARTNNSIKGMQVLSRGLKHWIYCLLTWRSRGWKSCHGKTMLYNTTAVAGGQGCHGQEAISDLNSCKRLIRPDVWNKVCYGRVFSATLLTLFMQVGVLRMLLLQNLGFPQKINFCLSCWTISSVVF